MRSYKVFMTNINLKKMEFNKNLIGIAGSIGSGKDTAASIIQYLIAKDRNKIANTTAFDEFHGFSLGVKSLKSDYVVKRFAGKLKQIVSLLTGIPVEDLEKESVKSTVLGPEWWYWMETSSWDYGLCIKTPYILGTSEVSSFMHVVLVKTTVRHLLQVIGTDALRDNVHKNIHVNALFADYNPVSFSYEKRDSLEVNGEMMDMGASLNYDNEMPKWIIPDLRFKNEGQAINSRGGICLLINNDRVTKGTHASENDLNNWNGFYACIDNSSTMTDFIDGIALVLRTLDIIK